MKYQSDLHPIDCTIYVCTLSTHGFFLKSSTLQPLKLETSNFSVSAKTPKRRWRSKVSFAVAAVGALLFHTAVGFVVPNLQRSNSKGVQGVQGALPAAKLPEQVVPGWNL